MNNSDNTFLGAYLKLERAKRHIGELKFLTEPLHPSLYTFDWFDYTGGPAAFNFFSERRDLPMKELAFVAEPHVRQQLALLMGDAIHNLRASLDYAATAVVRAMDGDTTYVTFPFHETREKLVAKESSGIRAIQTALPGADVEGFFKDAIKPYHAGNELLWTLTKLDKIDKHNFIIPTVMLAQLTQIGSAPAPFGVSLSKNEMCGDIDRRQTFVAGPIKDSDMVKYKVQITVSVNFPEGKYLSGLPVVPTLGNLAGTVFEALMAFEEFAASHGAEVRVPKYFK